MGGCPTSWKCADNSTHTTALYHCIVYIAFIAIVSKLQLVKTNKKKSTLLGKIKLWTYAASGNYISCWNALFGIIFGPTEHNWGNVEIKVCIDGDWVTYIKLWASAKICVSSLFLVWPNYLRLWDFIGAFKGRSFNIRPFSLFRGSKQQYKIFLNKKNQWHFHWMGP